MRETEDAGVREGVRPRSAGASAREEHLKKVWKGPKHGDGEFERQRTCACVSVCVKARRRSGISPRQEGGGTDGGL